MSMRRLVRITMLAGFAAMLAAPRSAAAYVDEVQASTRIEQYKPIYALIGDPDTKMQLSFRVKMLPLTGLYAAYSQVMLWRLWEPSKPFRDLNYNPEIFYRFELGDAPSWYVDLGLYEHESNGRDGLQSRSWDRSYVRYSMTHKLSSTSRARIHWNVKAWVPYNYDYDNTDIARYRGLYEAQVSLVDAFGFWLDRSDITLRFYGGGPSHVNPLGGGQEITIRFAPRLLSSSAAQIVIQYFHGYGENLLDFDREKSVFRAGLGF
jgi:phospholipase A1